MAKMIITFTLCLFTFAWAEFISQMADAHTLDLTSETSVITNLAGTNATFACIVMGAGFHYFYNQIIWYKVLTSGEEVQINTGATINLPFATTKRFSVEPDIAQQYQHIVSMQLTVRGLTLADNGTYRCDLLGRQGLIDSVTHYLLVLAPLKDIQLTIVNKTKDDTLDSDHQRDEAAGRDEYSSAAEEETNDVSDVDQVDDELEIDDEYKEDDLEDENYDNEHKALAGKRLLEVTEFEQLSVKCRTVGGNPSPVVRILKGDKDITTEFTRFESVTYSGSRGFEVQTPIIELVNNNWEPGMEWSREAMKCVAAVPGMPEFTVTDEVEVRVLYPPTFQCIRDRSVPALTKVVRLDCMIKANPPVNLHSIEWSFGPSPTRNATTVTSSFSVDGFHVDVMSHSKDPEAVTTTLVISSVDDSVFQTYVVSAANAVESKNCEIRLSKEKAYSPEFKLPRIIPMNRYQQGGSNPPNHHDPTLYDPHYDIQEAAFIDPDDNSGFRISVFSSLTLTLFTLFLRIIVL